MQIPHVKTRKYTGLIWLNAYNEALLNRFILLTVSVRKKHYYKYIAYTSN